MEEDDSKLVSDSIDDFLEAPKIESSIKKLKCSIEERNVYVTFDETANDSAAVKDLLDKLRKLCSKKQVITEKYNIAAFVFLSNSSRLIRLGFCDELTASNLVYRICKMSKVEVDVYRDMTTSKQRKITDEDLNKRPFRF